MVNNYFIMKIFHDVIKKYFNKKMSSLLNFRITYFRALRHAAEVIMENPGALQVFNLYNQIPSHDY